MINLTLPIWYRISGAPKAFADRYWPHAEVLLPKYGILQNNFRLAAWMATCRFETRNLQDIEEGLYYKDPVRIATIFRRVFDVNRNRQIDGPDIEAARPYARNPKGMSQALYKGCHGRGLIQLTWEENYRAYGNSIGVDIVSNPDLLLEPRHAVESACWFFRDKGCFVPADKNNMDGVTRIVNPAMMHAAERRVIYQSVLSILRQMR